MITKFTGLCAAAALLYVASANGAFASIAPAYDYAFHFSDVYGDSADIIFETADPTGPLPDQGALVINIFGFGSFPSLGPGTWTISGPNITPADGADNLLFSTAPYVDSQGIAFFVDQALIDPPFTITSNGLCSPDCNSGFLLDPSQYSFTPVASTPVPAALPLFATGLAGLGWLARRRRKQAA